MKKKQREDAMGKIDDVDADEEMCQFIDIEHIQRHTHTQ